MVPRQALAAWRRGIARMRAAVVVCAVGSVLAVSAPATGQAAPGTTRAEEKLAPATALVVGEDGALYAADSGSDGTWGRLTAVTPEDSAVPGTRVTTVRQPDGPLDAFYASAEGALMVSRQSLNGEWQRPVRLSDVDLIRLGCEVFVIHDDGVIHVFVTGPNGAVRYLRYEIPPPSEPWGPPTHVGLIESWIDITCDILMATILPTGLPALLGVGPDGALMMAENVGEDRWLDPRPVSPEGVAPPGAAVAVTGDDTGLRAFVVGEGGQPFEIDIPLDEPDVGEPRPIGPAKLAPAGAELSILSGPGERLNLFYAGNDGALYASRTDHEGTWIDPLRLSDVGVVPAGSDVTPYARGTRVDLAVNLDGELLVWWCPWPWPPCPCPFPPWPPPCPCPWFEVGDIFGNPIREHVLDPGGEVAIPELGGVTIG